MATTIKKYRLSCATDGDVHWHLPDDAALPTTCPIDTAHTINGTAVVVGEVKRSQREMTTVLADHPLKIAGSGFQFTATKAIETTHDHKLLTPIRLRGGIIETLKNEFGDSISLQIVDVDNVLGFGAGVVLSDYFQSWNMPLDPPRGSDNYGRYEILEPSIGTEIPANLYVRVKYNSVGSTNDVSVNVNLRAYKDA